MVDQKLVDQDAYSRGWDTYEEQLEAVGDNIIVDAMDVNANCVYRAFPVILAMIRNDEEALLKSIPRFPRMIEKEEDELNGLPSQFYYEYEGRDEDDNCWFTFGEFACFLGHHDMLSTIHDRGGFRCKNLSVLDCWCRCADSTSIECFCRK